MCAWQFWLDCLRLGVHGTGCPKPGLPGHGMGSSRWALVEAMLAGKPTLERHPVLCTWKEVGSGSFYATTLDPSPVGSFLITYSISLVVTSLLRFSISSCFFLGRLFVSWNLSISSCCCANQGQKGMIHGFPRLAWLGPC